MANDPTPSPGPANTGPANTLPDTAVLVAGHVWVERALFELTGRWSALDAGAEHAATQVFFASQSAFHGWRAEEWSRRLPRSVAAPDGPPEGSWSDVLLRLAALEDAAERLAVWAMALQPMLLARYRQHRGALAPAADGGLRRWLGLAIADVTDGWAEGSALLVASVGGQSAVQATRTGATALADLLSPTTPG